MIRKIALGVGILFAVSVIACEKSVTPKDDGSDGGSGGGAGAPNCSENYQSAECIEEWRAICQAKSLSECTATADCQVLSAYPMDSARECYETTQEVVGCGALGCGAALVVATDTEGADWLFPSTCLAKGFTEKSLSAPPDCDGLGGAGGEGGGGGSGP